MKIRTRLNRFVCRRRGNETHYGFPGFNGIYRPITADARPQTVFHLKPSTPAVPPPTPPAPPGGQKSHKSSQKFSKVLKTSDPFRPRRQREPFFDNLQYNPPLFRSPRLRAGCHVIGRPARSRATHVASGVQAVNLNYLSRPLDNVQRLTLWKKRTFLDIFRLFRT